MTASDVHSFLMNKFKKEKESWNAINMYVYIYL